MTKRGSGPYRLASGGLVDRHQSIPFTFNNKIFAGYSGDSLASALLACGVRTVARSLKFHRPRGVFACGVEEPNALLQIGLGAESAPSLRAPLVELTAGLHARSQAGWPSVDLDVGRSLDMAARLWSAGFYNKTFKWPSWHSYEPFIRRMTGLGRAPKERDPDRYEVDNLHCDVLVVGGGAAGLKAALRAGRSGARVVLVEQDHQWGGETAWAGLTIDGLTARAWVAETVRSLSKLPDVRMMLRSTVTGHYDHNVIALLERPPQSHSGVARERYWTLRTKRVVLATGAIEQPLVFAHNDRPGIILAGAARQYLRRYGVAVGSRVLLATNNDSAYGLAQDLKAAGVAVVAVADTRHSVTQSLRATMRALSIDIYCGHIPIDTKGFGSLHKVILGQLSENASRIDSMQTFDCDALAVSGGFNPSLHLYAQAGGKLVFDEGSGALRPSTKHPHIEIVGAAADRIEIGPRVSPVGDSKRQWVDLLHDVTVADLELALRENYVSVEHVKRYTTVGMAADQGKTSAAVTLGILSKLRGVSASELGHTAMRPPFTPVTLGAIAGREIGERFAPYRLSPMHAWHVARGGLIQDFGEWRRPVVYLRAGESREQATRREATAVRAAAGLFDASPLGKLEIHGPDALEFLNRFYINDLMTLKPMRARYGLMLRESGVIFDDGTVVMLARDRLVITTTSANAARVGQWLEEWHQCEWPQLRIAIVPVTEQWATVSLAGPKTREILSRLPTDIDLSKAGFPHLAVREGTLLGGQARIYRVSFTGELTFEINVSTDKGPALWEALLEAGGPEGLEPFGMDALLLMRLEKGYLHVGADTDGTTIPNDVGWGKVAANKSRDYVGRRSLALPENLKPDRWQLVGLSGPRDNPFVIGSHLRVKHSTHATDGWITSAGAATETQEAIALAMLRGGRSRIGTQVELYDSGVRKGLAQVVDPPFIDPAGDRMNA